MKKIGFIGLGHMGFPMAKNLIKAGYHLRVYDLSSDPLQTLTKMGATPTESPTHCAEGVDVVITMLPAGPQVHSVYLGENGLLRRDTKSTFFMDCSTIDVKTAREVAHEAGQKGHPMIDAPVSGGVKGAEAATLTFMVGGEKEDFDRAKPILEVMGKNIFHAGHNGHGQAAKICNNFMLAAHMIITSEAFNLGQRLGLDPQTFFDIASKSSGQSWSLTSYCPVPGPVPASPANRGYEAGFAASMMFKDLGLAVQAARETGTSIPLGGKATDLYKEYCDHGGKDKDFSGIIEYLKTL